MTEAQHLTQALGGQWRGHSGLAPCPVCQPERRQDQRGLSIRSEAGNLLAFCHKTGCDFRDIVRAAGLPPATFQHDPEEALRAAAQREAYADEQLTKARKLWTSGGPIHGTKGEAYLRGRGITCPLPPSLRWKPDTYHGPSGRWLSAMVADVATGGVHRTFFEKNGARITGNAKMMQGPCAGGYVALSEGAGPLVVCEGIETGLSLLSGLLDGPTRVWAALSTSGMRSLTLPQYERYLTIATDGDTAGRVAGVVLAERARTLGWKVGLLDPGNNLDFNDVLIGRAVAKCL